MVVCMERGADLHTAQLMPLPLTVSCLSEIQIGFTFLVPAHLGSPKQRAVKRVCVASANCGGCMARLTSGFDFQHRICYYWSTADNVYCRTVINNSF